MLIGGRNIHGIGGTWKRARRNARRGEFIALVMTVLAVYFLAQGTAVDGHARPEAFRLNRFGMLGEQEVRNDNDRALVFHCKIEGFEGCIDAVGRVPRIDEGARDMSLRGGRTL